MMDSDSNKNRPADLKPAPGYFDSILQSASTFLGWANPASSPAQQQVPVPTTCAATGKPTCHCSKNKP